MKKTPKKYANLYRKQTTFKKVRVFICMRNIIYKCI